MHEKKNEWDPKQYQKFAKERREPFYDLVKMVRKKANMNVLDLGCGTGELTSWLHEKLKAKKTMAIDASEAMLKEAVKYKTEDLKFKLQAIESFETSQKFDLIFSNAALQWLSNHEALFEKLKKILAKKGQLAVQMPNNFDFPTHKIAADIALEPPFNQFITPRKDVVLTIEAYARLLYRLGFKKQNVRQQIYPHLLESTDSVIEWVKGSLLTYYRSELPEDKYQAFLERYKAGLKEFFGDQSPFFFPFNRIFIWGEI